MRLTISSWPCLLKSIQDILPFPSHEWDSMVVRLAIAFALAHGLGSTRRSSMTKDGTVSLHQGLDCGRGPNAQRCGIHSKESQMVYGDFAVGIDTSLHGSCMDYQMFLPTRRAYLRG